MVEMLVVEMGTYKTLNRIKIDSYHFKNMNKMSH